MNTHISNSNIKNLSSQATAQLHKDYLHIIYSISHDLRAPLRGLGGFSKLLLQHYSDKLDE